MTHLFIKWITSQAYINNDVLLFPLQIWKQPHQIKCSDRFRVTKRDTDCFEHLHEENTKPSVNVSVSHAWIFLSTSVFYGFYRGERRSDRTVIEWERDVNGRCSCDYFLPLILVEKSVVKLQPLEAAVQGRYEK